MSNGQIPEDIKLRLRETATELNLQLEKLHGDREAAKLRVELLRFSIAVDLFGIENPLIPSD